MSAIHSADELSTDEREKRVVELLALGLVRLNRRAGLANVAACWETDAVRFEAECCVQDLHAENLHAVVQAATLEVPRARLLVAT